MGLKSNERYFARYKDRAAGQRSLRIARHKRRCELHTQPKVARGTARAARRRDIVKFKAAQRARNQKPIGTTYVNAPSLQLHGFMALAGVREEMRKAA